MPTTIKIKNGSGAPTSSDLVQGELAIDLTNKRLYTEDGSANILELGTSPSTIDINAGTIDGVTLGTNSAVTEAQIDNININGNTIISTDTNGNIAITPNGTGEVDISKVDINGGTIDGTVIGGASAAAGTFTTLTTSSTVTHNGGTANGVAYLNGSKVLTTGSALTFDGSSLASTSAWVVGSGQFFTNATSGNLSGISSKYNNSVKGYLYFDNSSTTYNLYGETGVSLAFSANASEKMRLTSTGLGIGTTSPQSRLDIRSGGSTTLIIGSGDNAGSGLQTIEFRDRYGTSGFANGQIGSFIRQERDGTTADYDLVFGTNTGTTTDATERMRIDKNGNVGIGTSSPAAPLDVRTDDATTNAVSRPLYLSHTTSGTAANGIGSGIAFQQESTTGTLRLSAYIDSIFTDATDASLASALTFTTRSGGSLTERMRIDSSGNVGIGTSSPLSTLTGLDISSGAISLIVGADNSSSSRTNSTIKLARIGTPHYTLAEEPFALMVTQSNATENYIRFGGGTGDLNAATLIQFYTAANNTTTTGSERMRIDSSGNVGIGTTSPATLLHIENGSADTRLRIISGTAFDAAIQFGDTASASQGAIIYSNNGDALRFQANGSERMRIDSSGNLLVGKTSDTFSTEGVSIYSSSDVNGSRVNATNDGAAPLNLNRLTSDGNITTFYKDNSLVGVIGVRAGTDIGIGTTNTGLRFYDANDSVMPCDPSNTFANRDASIDLGLAANRFKDLYLSGGVYVGGTTSANLLDDYEEGTWTPVIGGSGGQSGQSYSIQQGNYTKIGDQVICHFRVRFDGTAGAKGTITTYVNIQGLPFTSNNSSLNYRSGGFCFVWSGMTTSVTTINLSMENNSTSAVLQVITSAATTTSLIQTADVSDNLQLQGFISYKV